MQSDTQRQRTCGTMEKHRQLLRSERYRAERLKIEEFTRYWIDHNADAGLRAGVIRIPVVVHVVYNTPAQNVSVAQIQSQIDILNHDFRKTNADAGLVPAVFQPLAADCRLEFALAARDPNCQATTGITRTQTATTVFHNTTDDIKSAATGGHAAWPRDKYLNLWVAPRILDSRGRDLLGYAQFPGGPAATDGVVILHSALGNTGTALAPYDRGRSATHEIGHWLNLLHIWGDDNGACSGSDSVADTPNQASEHFGAPAFPSVSCSNGPNGDMFMNYMDYVDDVAMFMFTAGQSSRMDATLNGTRSAIVGSDGLVPPLTSAATDLWSQDRPEDLGAEPDPSAAPMWESDDIWVRRQNDGFANQDHQNPEYRPAGFGSNFVYVRVRNRGCSAAGSGTLKLYWAKASTALAWPQPWDGTVTSPALMGGVIGSQPTGSVAAGGFVVLEFPWYPPNPANYASFGADQSHFCLLSRVETAAVAPFGMTFPESTNLYANVQNNNNIVWKNISVVDELPGGGRVAYVSVGNVSDQTPLVTLVFAARKEERRTIFDWGEVRVALGPKLYERWKESGALSDQIQVAGADEIALLGNGARLNDIRIDPRELFTIRITFEPRERQPRNEVFFLDLVEYVRAEDGRYEVVGGQQFVVKTLVPVGPEKGHQTQLTFDGAEWIDVAQASAVDMVASLATA
jgi:Pregnancy-associated plasma protein-A